MIKDEQHQQSLYPVQQQMPSAPPTYEEAMFNPQMNQAYASNPPPGPGFIPPAPGAAAYVQPTMVEIQRTIIALPLGPNPARITCPQCRAEVVTTTDSEPSCAAHLCCLLLLLIGCCPFSSLPYCMDSLRNTRHTCPNCKVFLGSFQP